jgi:hypothetical protein
MRSHPTALLFALLVSACSDGSGPDRQDPDAVADRLEQLAQQADRAGDAERSTALTVAAAGVRTAGAVATLTVNEGGTVREYQATVFDLTVTIPAHESPFVGVVPEETLALRQLLAWSRGDARRLMSVATLDGDTAEFDFSGIPGTDYSPIMPAVPLPVGIAMLLRGPADFLFATGGGAGIHLVSAAGSCPQRPAGASTCERASFTANGRIVFEGFDPEQPFTNPDADPFTGETVTVEFDEQTLVGARVAATCPIECFGPGYATAAGVARVTGGVLAHQVLTR